MASQMFRYWRALAHIPMPRTTCQAGLLQRESTVG
jgi:hypothetical protein